MESTANSAEIRVMRRRLSGIEARQQARRLPDLDGRRELRAQPRHREVGCGVQQHGGAQRVQLADAGPVAQQQRQGAQEAAGRVTDVLQHVVPGEGAGALGLGPRRRQDGLLDDQRGAAIPALPVQHAEERSGRDQRRVGGQARSDPAARTQQREHDQGATPAEPVAEERHRRHPEGRAGESGGDHQADRGGIEPQPGQVQAQQDADHPRRDGAQERRRIDEVAVGQLRRQVVPPGPSSSRMPFPFSSSRMRSASAQSFALRAARRRAMSPSISASPGPSPAPSLPRR